MPTSKSPSEINDEFWVNLGNELKSLERREDSAVPPPSNYLESLSPECVHFDFSTFNNLLADLTSRSNDPIRSLDFLNEHPELTLLTIATGNKGEAIILHNFQKFEFAGQGEPIFVALCGAGTNASVVQINASRLLNQHTIPVPDLRAFVGSQDFKSVVATHEGDKPVTQTVANSVVLTPKLTELIMKTNSSSIEQISETVLHSILLTNSKDHEDWSKKKSSEEVEKEAPNTDFSGNFGNEALASHLTLLQQLFGMYKAGKREASFSLLTSPNPLIDEWLARSNSRFSPNRLQSNSPPPPESVEKHRFNLEQMVKSGQAKNPLVFTGGSKSGAQKPQLQVSINSSSPPGDNNVQFSSNSPGDLTGSGGINASSQSSSVDASTNAILAKVGNVLETLVGTQAASMKQKQKISSNTRSWILNAMTKDGETPAAEILDEFSDLMRGSIENASLGIDLWLKQARVQAVTTPRFITSAQKARLDYPPGEPDNMSLFCIHSSFSGTDLEHIDFQQLKEEELNGRNLSDKERNALYKKFLNVSRTISFLTDRMQAFIAPSWAASTDTIPS
jgi:hypothetical protein